METRFPCDVDEAGRLVPVHPERTLRRKGKRVWVSIHDKPAQTRGKGANAYLWGVVYGTLAEETGNDPGTIHFALKTEAVRVGVLEKQFIVMGHELLEGEPTTVVEDEAFWKYVNWVRELAEHGQLTGQPCHIPEPGE